MWTILSQIPQSVRSELGFEPAHLQVWTDVVDGDRSDRGVGLKVAVGGRVFLLGSEMSLCKIQFLV